MSVNFGCKFIVALIDCASIIWLNRSPLWVNKYNFCPFYKSSSASVLTILFFFFLKEKYQIYDLPVL